MKKLPELEYLGLPPIKQFGYNFCLFFAELPSNFLKALKKIPKGIWKLLCSIGSFFAEIGSIFKNGDWKTRLSFFVMGFGQFFRGTVKTDPAQRVAQYFVSFIKNGFGRRERIIEILPHAYGLGTLARKCKKSIHLILSFHVGKSR